MFKYIHSDLTWRGQSAADEDTDPTEETRAYGSSGLYITGLYRVINYWKGHLTPSMNSVVVPKMLIGQKFNVPVMTLSKGPLQRRSNIIKSVKNNTQIYWQIKSNLDQQQTNHK